MDWVNQATNSHRRTGPDHRKTFVVAVKFLEPSAAQPVEQTLASATGTRKKHAEQEAARLALQHLRSSDATQQLPLAERPASAGNTSGKTTVGKRK